jgi:hypothetical protein
MAFCHQSQIAEWLPWVGRHKMQTPQSYADWRITLRQRFDRKNRELGIQSGRAVEVFTVTAWGTVPDFAQLCQDLPNILPKASHLDRLKARLDLWSSA